MRGPWNEVFTPAFVQRATAASPARAAQLAPHIAEALHRYKIRHREDIAFWFAQIGHETGGLRWLTELWGPTAQQRRYECDPTQAFNAKNQRNKLAFALGNKHPGDGSRYRGRGGIQTTGRHNYAALRDRMRWSNRCNFIPDFEEQPALVAEPRWAMLSACDFWEWKGITKLALTGDFIGATRRINGGTNGLADRQARLAVARATCLFLPPLLPL